MSMKTSVLVAKDGARTVYHQRTAPPDKRRPEEEQNRVTHVWEHADDEATRAACDACQHGTLPKEVRVK